MNKKLIRIKRSKKIKNKLKNINIKKLIVYKSNRYIYAQITNSNGSKTLVSASNLENEIKKKINNSNNKKTAYYIGKIIANRAIKKNIRVVAFNRSGYKYHGRIKKLAESARKFGLKF